MCKTLAVGILSTCLLLTAEGTGNAHHSFAGVFDANKPMTLKGRIVKMAWTNPHAYLYIEVPGPKGQPVTWELEFGGPGSLYRRGWKKTDLPIGTEVTVFGYLARDGTPSLNAITVTLPDGRELFAGSAGNGAPQGRGEHP